MEEYQLIEVSSFIRDIRSMCTVIKISDDYLVSGSQKGILACWTISSGTENWRIEFEGPCSEVCIEGNNLYLTEEGNIHLIDLNLGKIKWSKELEGLSDFIQVSGENIWVTSSIYDLHISNYSESTVWLFDKNGLKLEEWLVEGKPWFFGVTKYGVYLGLSRPKCGYAKISIGKEVEYITLKNKNPITTGFLQEDIIFLGHSDGKISELNNNSVREIEVGDRAVNTLEYDEKIIVGLESGEIYSENGWKNKIRNSIDKIMKGPPIDDLKTIWLSSWENSTTIYALDIMLGEVKYEINHVSRIREMVSFDNFIALGDSEGKIFLIENVVFNRRIKSKSEVTKNDQKRVLLKDRLRRLRE